MVPQAECLKISLNITKHAKRPRRVKSIFPREREVRVSPLRKLKFKLLKLYKLELRGELPTPSEGQVGSLPPPLPPVCTPIESEFRHAYLLEDQD